MHTCPIFGLKQHLYIYTYVTGVLSKMAGCMTFCSDGNGALLVDDHQVSNEKKPGCLGDCTSQLYGDYNKPL